MSKTSSDPSTSSLGVFEFLTVSALLGIAMAFARPQLEGWGILEMYRVAGFWYNFFGDLRGDTMRAFEHVGLGIAWLVGHGSIWAVAMTYGLVIVAKYFAARWAVSPLMKRGDRWVVSTIAAVMLPWVGQWRGHNLAQEVSAAFILVTFGTTVRLRERVRVGWVLLGGLALLYALLTYEALILCVAALPCISLFERPQSNRAMLRQLSRAALPVLVGGILYGLLSYWSLYFYSLRTYHQVLLSGPQPIKTPLKLLLYLYHTTYFRYPWIPLVLFVFLAIPAVKLIWEIPRASARVKQVLALLGSIAVLPLFALPYAVNFYFLSDRERLGYPTGFAFFLLSVALFQWVASKKRQSEGLKSSMAMVLMALCWATANAYHSYKPYKIQRAVLDPIEAIVAKNHPDSILVRDWSGLLGDVYTFQYSATLSQALNVEGFFVKHVDLCTPQGVGRYHPEMGLIEGVSPLAWCEAVPAAKLASLILDVRPDAEHRFLVTTSDIKP